MTRVKICGCVRAADAVAAAEAGADFIGLMFAEDSRRRVSMEEARSIVSLLGPPLREIEQTEPPPLHPGTNGEIASWFAHGADALERLLKRKRPLVVGVFADQPIEVVNELADEAGIDLIQLSGNEPWSDCLLANRQTINVVRTRDGMTASEIVAGTEAGGALALMLDPSSGSGTRGDWATAGEVASRMPIWLAGGLTPGNVAEAIAAVHPWCVDASTGLETEGSKDAAKIAAFVRAAKGVA